MKHLGKNLKYLSKLQLLNLSGKTRNTSIENYIENEGVSSLSENLKYLKNLNGLFLDGTSENNI